MGQEKEVRKLENRAGRIFEAGRKELIRVLSTPLVPREVSKRLRSNLSRVRLLSDEEYLAEAKATSPFPDIFDSDATRDIMTTFAMYIPANPKLRKDEIIVRRGFLEHNLAAEENVFIILTEELAHSLTSERRFPLTEISDNSALLLPHLNKEDLLEKLNGIYAQYYNPDRKLDPEKVVACRGFNAVYVNEEAQDWFPKFREQMVLEESRSSVIQTMFVIFSLMDDSSPQPIEKKFNTAMDVLEVVLKSPYRILRLREKGALVFLRAYLKRPGELKALIKDLFSNLSYMTFDEFLLTLSEEEQEAFLTTIKFIAEEYKKKPEEPDKNS